MTPAEILNRAADVIDSGGWCQGQYRNFLGAHCAIGGLFAVTDTPHIYGLVAIIEATIGRTIVGWNDAPERTKDEVTSTLRAIAATLRAQADKTPLKEKVTA